MTCLKMNSGQNFINSGQNLKNNGQNFFAVSIALSMIEGGEGVDLCQE